MGILRRHIKELARELEAEDNAAHDLWSWLPSYKVAQRFHGDYASDAIPPVDSVLEEAARYIASLVTDSEYVPWDCNCGQCHCPCGECHIEELEAAGEWKDDDQT